jgi:hypothetical protein
MDLDALALKAWHVAKDVVTAGFIIWGAWHLAIDTWDRWDHPGPSAGDQCGPHHHWGYIGPPSNPDLSCEEDGE